MANSNTYFFYYKGSDRSTPPPPPRSYQWPFGLRTANDGYSSHQVGLWKRNVFKRCECVCNIFGN